MKILFVNMLYASAMHGGAEKVVRTLAEGLVEKGHEVVVATLAPDGRDTKSEHNGVRVYQVRLANLYYPLPTGGRNFLAKAAWHALDAKNLLMARRLGRLLDEERPDIVHTHVIAGFSPAIWAAVKRRRIPLAHSLHDVYLICIASTMFRNGRNCRTRCPECVLLRIPHARATRQVDMVIGVSGYILKKHLDHGLFAGTPARQVVLNGHAPPRDRITPTRSSALRFGFLGALAPHKGIEALLKALIKVPETGWTLTIGGSGSTEFTDRLKATYDDPRIRFLGSTDADAFMQTIDVLVLPSRWHETASMTIGEAHSFGVPVIGSRRGGTPELVDEGRTGYIFDPDKPAEFQEVLTRAIREKATLSAMRGDCLSAAAGRTVEVMVSRHVEIYQALAGGTADAPSSRPQDLFVSG